MEENNKMSVSEERKTSKGKYRFRRFCLLLAVLIFVWWFNNFTIRTTCETVCSAKIKEPIKIAVISDLHVSDFGISGEKAASAASKLNADIVAILGDMYTRGSSRNKIDKAVGLVKNLVSNGSVVYFVSGEHDTDAKYIEDIRLAGAHVMNYRSEYVEIKGNRLQIIGIDNAYYSPTFDLKNEFEIDRSCYSILLAHIPNYEKFAQFGADLTLCADTHGGMIQLPFNKGPVYSSELGVWFPELKSGSKVYDKGLFTYNGGAMFITSGIGNYPVPARLNNRPEIALITIEPENK